MIYFQIFIVLLCTAILIFCGFSILYFLFKKNYSRIRKLLKWPAAALLIMGLIFRVIPGSDFIWSPLDNYMERNYHEDIFGLRFNELETVFEYNSERHFNGDGYSIRIVSIDDETINYFKSVDERFFNLPSDEYRPNWHKENWKSTPIKSEENTLFHFAKYDNLPIDSIGYSLKDLLIEDGNYYSYYSNRDDVNDNHIRNIDFLIVSPQRGIIVFINHNT